MTILLVLVGIWFGEARMSTGAGEIKRVIEEFVRQEFHGSKETARVEFRNLPPAVTVVGDSCSLRVVNRGLVHLRGNMSLPVEILSKGQVVRTLLISFKVRTFGDVLVAARQLSRYEVPVGDDVVVQNIETTSLPEDILCAPAELTEKRTTRIIARGSVLYANMVEPLPMVRRGETVTLLAKIGGVEVATQALAKEDGGNGKVIVVQKLGAREQLKARVVSKNVVELEIR